MNKRMNKKLLSIMMAAMMLSMTACTQNTSSESDIEPEVESIDLDSKPEEDSQANDSSDRTDDTEEQEDLASDDSYDFGDMDPIYVSYLKNETSVENPYVEGDSLNILDYKEDYTTEYEGATIGYALVDVNGDGKNELVVDISNSSDQLLEIFTIADGKLKVVDIFESHNFRMGASVYANGIVMEETTVDDTVSSYFTYDLSGNRKDMITFYEPYDSESPLPYEYYYLDGNEDDKVMLSSEEEYNEIRAKYVGRPIDYTDITEYVESL